MIVSRIRRDPTIGVLAFFVLVAVVILTLGFTLTGCGKAAEPYQDAGVGDRNTGNADVINMPDGFSNVSTKCDHGNRIYVVFHGDSAYGSVAVVAKDPTCPQ